LSVATRQSSDVTAIADPCLASAMQFIREHACAGIGVDDVLDHLTVSRSALQRLFRKELGHSILDAITAIRMQRVKQLLTETDLPLTDIADRAGFNYVEYLSTSFRRETGQSPSSYRQKFRH
jgi:LacI family transcriptional regulator